MSKFGDVAYVSINVKGTNIFVTVTKKDESLEQKKDTNYCNIIANKDGIIEKVIPRSGKQVVNPGDIVRKGDVLVSGANSKSIPEVWATTYYESRQTANYIEQEKEKTGNKKKVYTFSFYDKNFIMRKKIDYKNYEIENKEYKISIGDYTFPLKVKVSIFHEVNVKEIKKDSEEVKKQLMEKAEKELEYIMPVDARLKDAKHQYKVKKDKLEYIITVTMLENISNVYPLSKSEAQQLIMEESKPKEEGAEAPPSNPDKRPITDIRNEFEDPNLKPKEEEKKEQN